MLFTFSSHLDEYFRNLITNFTLFAAKPPIVKPSRFVSSGALILAFLVLASSVGVAQVSHICKLALAGMEQKSCSTDQADEHACCREESEKGSNETDDPCCTNEVKVFSQEVISTPPVSGKTLAVEATEISLIAFPLLLIEDFIECNGNTSYPLAWSIPVPDILTHKCTLLI